MKNFVKSLIIATGPAALIALVIPAFAATVHSADSATATAGIGIRSDPSTQSPSPIPTPSATPTPTPVPVPTPTPAPTFPHEAIDGMRS
ncbi:MAG: hypothetical protein WCD79_13395 [Chthoniobacteraceae bacterium]